MPGLSIPYVFSIQIVRVELRVVIVVDVVDVKPLGQKICVSLKALDPSLQDQVQLAHEGAEVFVHSGQPLDLVIDPADIGRLPQLEDEVSYALEFRSQPRLPLKRVVQSRSHSLTLDDNPTFRTRLPSTRSGR